MMYKRREGIRPNTEWGHAQPVLDYWGNTTIFSIGKAVNCEQ